MAGGELPADSSLARLVPHEQEEAVTPSKRAGTGSRGTVEKAGKKVQFAAKQCRSLRANSSEMSVMVLKRFTFKTQQFLL